MLYCNINFKIAKFKDFGLSNSLDEREFLNTQCGSPAYAAPESMLKLCIKKRIKNNQNNEFFLLFKYSLIKTMVLR
jgi:serine/threonine protein kinase